MSDDVELMVEYLVSLQFYSDEDESIFSRDKKTKIQIAGLGLRLTCLSIMELL